MELIAGLLLDGIVDLFPAENNPTRLEKVKALASHLSHFDLDSGEASEALAIGTNSVWKVITNLLQRGTPTKLNLFAVKKIAEKSGQFDVKYSPAGIKCLWKNQLQNADLIFRSLHIVDPRITADVFKKSLPVKTGLFGSKAEEIFFYSILKEVSPQNGGAIMQLVDLQRSLDNVFRGQYPDGINAHVRNKFTEQDTDFTIEFPYHSEKEKRGVIIEVDGSQHHTNESQRFLDGKRDESAVYAGLYPTIRIPVENLSNEKAVQTVRKTLNQALKTSFVEEILKNFSSPLLYQKQELEILQLTLIPFGIARIQRALVELLSNERMQRRSQLKIAVIERDVPCAALAVDDLKVFWMHLKEIAPTAPEFPEIILDVFCTKEFEHSNFQFSDQVQRIEDFSSKNQYDFVLDVSVLQRKHCTKPVTSSSPVYTIRSTYGKDVVPVTQCGPHIQYLPLCHRTEDERWINDDQKVSSLTYLLQSIFRKNEFRPGQIPIISKALQARSVIGLLPTGGGKSITYQLAALLQPGVCLVIDPIRSLMADQVDGLYENDIHTAQLINSTLKGKEKQAAIQRMAKGEAQFVFISPERLQMEEFRGMLRTMHEDGFSFSYCVIDEAHCVSEWGHDFRTAYLQLGANAYRYCLTATKIPVPLFGLTATASFDVLADIQRELSGHGAYHLDEDSLVRFESTIRPEIQFVVEDITLAEKNYENVFGLMKALGTKKRERIAEILGRIPTSIATYIGERDLVFDSGKWDAGSEEEKKKLEEQWEQIKKANYQIDNFFQAKNGGLIFCPHKSGPYGITNQFKPVEKGKTPNLDGVYDKFRFRDGIKAGFFMGAGDEQDETADVVLRESMANQKAFKSNHLNLMVATKAFGMGIDKPNIRYTIHMNYPGSIESFVQEAGRAGRDRGLAISYLLINRDDTFTVGKQDGFDHDKEVNLYFHKNSFKGIQKELAVLDELLTEIYLPDRTAEIEALIEQHFEEKLECTYSEKGGFKTLFLSKGYQQSVGYINLINLKAGDKKSIDLPLANKVLPFVVNHIKNLHLTIPAWEWIQQSDKEAGIEQVLKGKPIGQNFEITLGFINNQWERVKTLTKWLQSRVHSGLSESWVKDKRGKTNNSDEFIEALGEQYAVLNNGAKLDFEAACKASDKNKGNPEGYALKMFSALFNGYRNKMDTERAIYRLITLGVIDDYTVDFNAQTFTITGTKKSDQDYEDIVSEYLKKFFSGNRVKQELKKIKQVKENTYLRKCLAHLVTFVYETIKAKRASAIDEMKKACIETIEKGEDGNLFLREYIDLYFNSKYARKGYQYEDADGKAVDASLSDQTEIVKNANEKLIWSFIDHINHDPTGTEIENTKHLRGACVRMITAQPQNFVFRFLNSFCLFVLEWRNERLLHEAIEQLMLGFDFLNEEKGPKQKELERVFNKFKSLVYGRNPNLESALERLGLALTFDTVMLSQTIKKVSLLNSRFKQLTHKLIPDGI